MHKLKRIVKILCQDQHPLSRLLVILLMKVPFDVGKLIRITIKVQDFSIRLHSTALSMSYWHNPWYGASEYIFITSYLKPNDVYLDVGANIGTTLIPAAKSVKGGRAIGFEPHPKVFTYLLENIALNNLEKQVELHNCALGSMRGLVNFSTNKMDNQNRVLLSKSGMLVPLRRLDDFSQHYSAVALLKIDVEGYEKFVLEGGKRTLEKTECVYCEVSDEHFNAFGYSVRDLLVLFSDMGFRLYRSKEPGILEPINCDYRPSVHHENIFALRSPNRFIGRTGWIIVETG